MREFDLITCISVGREGGKYEERGRDTKGRKMLSLFLSLIALCRIFYIIVL